MSAPGEQVVIEPMKLGLGATSFNKEVKSFIPKGKMVTTAEEFPDLDDAFDEKPKQAAKKKKEKDESKHAPHDWHMGKDVKRESEPNRVRNDSA